MLTITKDFFAFFSESKSAETALKEAMKEVKTLQTQYEERFKGKETILSLSDLIVGHCFKRTVVYLMEDPVMDDVRNKIGPWANLVATLKTLQKDPTNAIALWKVINEEIKQSEENIAYLKNR